jgi:hypothetical protein
MGRRRRTEYQVLPWRRVGVVDPEEEEEAPCSSGEAPLLVLGDDRPNSASGVKDCTRTSDHHRMDEALFISIASPAPHSLGSPASLANSRRILSPGVSPSMPA